MKSDRRPFFLCLVFVFAFTMSHTVFAGPFSSGDQPREFLTLQPVSDI